MRDMLGKVKEEKIRLVRRNMSDLKGTYEKFLMQNAMAGEDVRSEAMRTIMKWEDGKAVIRALEEKLEAARILDIKKETKWRKERESYEMAIEDYDNECYRHQLDIGVGENRISYLEDELDKAKYQINQWASKVNVRTVTKKC